MRLNVFGGLHPSQKLRIRTTAISAAAVLLLSSLTMAVSPFIDRVFATGQTDVSSHVVINEIYPSPSSGSEWVELYNPTGSPVDVTGWTIADTDSHSQTLSGSISSFGHLTFDITTGGLLNNASDTIVLSSGTTVDSVAYPSIASDKSYGRSYDRNDAFVIRSGADVTKNASNPLTFVTPQIVSTTPIANEAVDNTYIFSATVDLESINNNSPRVDFAIDGNAIGTVYDFYSQGDGNTGYAATSVAGDRVYYLPYDTSSLSGGSPHTLTVTSKRTSGNQTIVNDTKTVNFTENNSASADSAPIFESITPAEGEISLDSSTDAVLEIDAKDADGDLAALEVDNTIEDFTVYANDAAPYGGTVAKNALNSQGVVVDYDAPQEKWTITISGAAKQAMLDAGNVSFYYQLIDQAGNMTPNGSNSFERYDYTACSYDFAASKMWEVTWGYDFENRNGNAAIFNTASHGGLVSINGNTLDSDITNYDTEHGAGSYHWLYTTAGNDKHVTYEFADGTSHSVDVTYSDVNGCEKPNIVWNLNNDNNMFSIGGYVFNNKNQDLNFDTGEEKLSGWDVNLYYQENSSDAWALIGSDTTDADGSYHFGSHQPAGTYYVCEVLKSGWTQTKQNWSGTPFHVVTPNASTNKANEGPWCTKTTYNDTADRSRATRLGNVDITAPTISNVRVDNPVSGTVEIRVDIHDVSGVDNTSSKTHVRFFHGSDLSNASGASSNVAFTYDSGADDYVATIDTTTFADDGSGSYWIYVRAEDNAGNAVGNDDTRDVVVDNVAPSITDLKLNGKAVQSDNLAPKNCSLAVAPINVSSKAKITATVAETVSGLKYSNFVVRKMNSSGCTNGNIVGTGIGGEVNISSLNGLYRIDVRTSDKAGNTTTKHIDILVDNTDPASPSNLKWNSADGENYTNESAVYPSWGTVSEDVNGNTDNIDHYEYQYKKGNDSWRPSTTYVTASGEERNLQSYQGVWQFRVRAVDVAGNESDWKKSDPIVYDINTPSKPTAVAVWQNGVDKTGLTINNPSVVVKWTAPNDNDVAYYVYQAASDNGTWTKSNPWHTDRSGTSRPGTISGEGVHYYRVQAVDKAGNHGSWSDWAEVTLDTIKPSITLNAIPEFVNGAVELSGTAGDNGSGLRDKNTGNGNDSAGDFIRLSVWTLVGGVRDTTKPHHTYKVPVESDGTWTLDIDTVNEDWFVDGAEYSVVTRANDNTGTSYKTSLTADDTDRFTVDNTAPVVSATDYSETDNKIQPNFNVEDADTTGYVYAWTPGSDSDVSVSDQSVLNPVFTVNNDGTYTYTLTVADPAGNVTTKTFTFTYTTPVPPEVPEESNIVESDVEETAVLGAFTGVTVANLTTGGGTPAVTTEPIALEDNGEEVKGLSTSEVAGDEAKSGVKSASTEEGCGKFLGICWYWWIPIVIAAIVVAYLLFRPRREEA